MQTQEMDKPMNGWMVVVERRAIVDRFRRLGCFPEK